MTDIAEVRSEFQGMLLEIVLDRAPAASDFLDWEAGLSLDELPGDLRAQLDLVALIAEEVSDGIRGAAELVAAATTVLQAPRLKDAESPRSASTVVIRPLTIDTVTRLAPV